MHIEDWENVILLIFVVFSPVLGEGKANYGNESKQTDVIPFGLVVLFGLDRKFHLMSCARSFSAFTLFFMIKHSKYRQ